MIVTCEKCSTRFELDDAKVPKQGIRVRCSQCKHAFLIEPPELSTSDRVHRAAEEALSGSAPSIPEPSQDLPDSEAADPNQDAAEEPEWTFNHDFGEIADASRPAVDPGAVAQSAVDDMLGASSSDTDARGELAEDPGEAANLADDPSVPDLVDGPGEAVNLADDPSIPDLVDHASLPRDFSDLGTESPPPDLAEESIGEAAPATASEFESGADQDPQTPGVAIGSIFSIASADESKVDASLTSAPVDVASRASTASIWLGRIAHGVGWMVTLVLVAATFHGALGARTVVSASGALSPVVAGMVMESVTGRWIENKAAGPIFVVSGTLRRTDPGPGSPRLAVRLFDAEGQALENAATPIAPLLARRSLRESDPRGLARYQQEGARQLAQTVLATGERRAFQALFLEVPAAAVEFRLVVLANPGDQRP